MKNNSLQSATTAFVFFSTLILSLLKITQTIQISWLWVLLPVEVPLVVFVLLIVLFFIKVICKDLFKP
jgi:hypothetical protein